MKSIQRPLLFGFAFAGLCVLANQSDAQVPFAMPESDPLSTAPAEAETRATTPATPPRLVDSVASSSDIKADKPTVQELRQARAQYRAKQRIARMERNLWNGYEPLRPNWNSIPMMSSRYPQRHRIVVPVYVYPR
jgi:hypothetical protein